MALSIPYFLIKFAFSPSVRVRWGVGRVG